MRIQAVVRMRPMLAHEKREAAQYAASSDVALRSQHNTIVRIDFERSEAGAATVVCTDPTAYLMLGNAGCVSFIYRFIFSESCLQFDSRPPNIYAFWTGVPRTGG